MKNFNEDMCMRHSYNLLLGKKTMDELIEEQSQEYFYPKRSEIIKEINSHLLEQSYRIMPATQETLWAWTKDLKNMHPNFSGFEYSHWENVWLDR